MINFKKPYLQKNSFDIGVVVFIVFLPLLYFADSLFTDTLIPDGDWYHLFYPIRTLANAQLHQGQFPLWNPYIYMGSPLFASWQVAVLYPLNLLFLPIDSATAMKWVSAINIMIAGLSMYLLTRQVARLRPVSALVSSVLFMFGGFFSMHYEHINQVNVGVWIPLVLFCFHRSCLDRDWQITRWKQTLKFGLAGGLIVAIQVFGGHPQILFYSLLLLALYSLFLIFITSQDRKTIFGRVLVAGFLFIIIGFGISAIQWMPTRELSNLSLRVLNSYDFGIVDSLPPVNLLTFILPHALGFPGEKYWGEANFTEATGYMSVLSIFLIALSFCHFRNSSLKHTNSRWFYLFIIIIAGIGLLLGLGKYDPLYPLAYRIIFPLQYFRCPARMLLLMNLSLSILSGYGWSYLQEQFEKDNRSKFPFKLIHCLALAMILLAVIALPWVYQNLASQKNLLRDALPAFYKDAGVMAGVILSFYLILYLLSSKKIRYQFGLTILILVMLLDLFYFSRGLPFHWLIERKLLEQPNPTALILKSTPGPFRTFRILNEVSIADVRLRATLEREYRIQPDLNVLYRVADLMGYEEGLLPVGWYYKYMIGMLMHQFYSPTPNAPLLGSMNVKYLLADKPIYGPGFKFVSQVDDIQIFRNEQFLPLVYWVPHAMVFKDDDAVFEEIVKPSFSPQSTILLLQSSGLKEGPNDTTVSSSPPQIDFQEISPTQIKVNAKTSRNGFLVFSMIHYPGWQCFIDHQQVPVYRANSICNAVYITSGSHHILFQYNPKSFRVGKLISIISAILVLILVIVLFFV